MTTICLNMIVKNESQIITRLLKSVVNIIDTYVICDTGSSDNTINIIESYFNDKNIYGEIIEESFKNFEYNRNIALNYARNKADYILFLDADMKLVITSKFNKNTLTKDIYLLEQITSNLRYCNIRLIKSKLNFKYKGVTHEYCDILDSDIKCCKLNSIYIEDIGDGGNKKNKYVRDIKLLSEGILNEPDNTRYYFYLAQTYFDIKDYKNAEKWYLKRIEKGGWIEEVWYSYVQLGEIYIYFKNYDKAIITWLNAYDYYPVRGENLYKIINYYRTRKKNHLALSFYKIAKCIKYPINDVLFINHNIYNYLLDYEYLIFSTYLPEVKEIDDMNYKIVEFLNKDVPFKLSQIILKTIPYYNNCISKVLIKKYNFTTSLNYNNKNFNSSTPSIIKYNNKYIMNLRFVNYYINNEGQYLFINNNLPTISKNGKLISINKYIILNNKFEIEKETVIKSTFDEKLYYHAYEDIRLFKYNDKILFTCSGQNTSDNMKINVGYGIYNSKNIKSIYLNSPFNRNCEKNWSIFKHKNNIKFIYEWFPLQIGELKNNKFIIIKNIKTPFYFKYIKGSTPGFLFKDEIWFVGHLVVYNENLPREYYHCIIILDINTLKIKKYSKPFYFTENYENTIEYCLGIVIEENRIIFSYSVMDSESYISIYNKKDLIKQIF